jgi:transglutaminase-like putative cysteine protease
MWATPPRRAARSCRITPAHEPSSVRISPGAALTPHRPIVDGARELCRYIYETFEYDPSFTEISTPLSSVLAGRRGVCQDFAHLAAGCLRTLGLAARYVSGYIETDPPPGAPRLVGADASHAWSSCWCGPLGWIDFDPTNNCFVGESHVTIAWGRDYSDVCPIKGVFIGGGEHAMNVSVDVESLTG